MIRTGYGVVASLLDYKCDRASRNKGAAFLSTLSFAPSEQQKSGTVLERQLPYEVNNLSLMS